MLGTHPFIRFINQNRRQIFISILVIVMFFLALRLLNNMAEKQQENTIKIANENYTQVYGSNEPKKIAEDFIKYCIKNDESSAYALLSSEIKEKDYKTSTEFNTNYIKKYFGTAKTYSISYVGSTENEYIYNVKISDDIMATGKISNNSAIATQKITVVKKGQDFKINEIK